MNNLIIGIAGGSGSGKTTLAHFVAAVVVGVIVHRGSGRTRCV